MRHSTIDSVDDVLVVFCAGSLRFSGSDDEESPLDLIMMTGPTTPLFNTKAIDDAVAAKITKDFKTYLFLEPD